MNYILLQYISNNFYHIILPASWSSDNVWYKKQQCLHLYYVTTVPELAVHVQCKIVLSDLEILALLLFGQCDAYPVALAIRFFFHKIYFMFGLSCSLHIQRHYKYSSKGNQNKHISNILLFVSTTIFSL